MMRSHAKINGTKKWATYWTLAALIAGAAGYGIRAARADGPPTTGALTYAGALEDGAGVSLTRTKTLQVKVWDAAASGTGNELCSSGSPQALIGGKSEIPIPHSCAAGFKANSNAGIEVTVDGTVGGRSKVGAVPRSARARVERL